MTKKFPGLLSPYISEEAALMGVAVQRTGWSDATLRDRAVRFGLGRKIGTRWTFSRVAIELFLNGQDEALAAYHRGDRSDPIVAETFERLDVPLTPPPTHKSASRGGAAHAAA